MLKIVLIFLLFPVLAKSQTISTIAGNGTAVYSGDNGPAVLAGTPNPGGGDFDADGNYFFADGTSNRIRKIDSVGIITTFAGSGVGSSTGDGGPAIFATFNSPQCVKIDRWGNIYVVESAGNVVRKIDGVSKIISTVAGTGSAGFSGDGFAATSAQLNNPQSVAIDTGGNVYISDMFNYRIRKVNRDGIISTYAGNGVSGFSGDGGIATSASLGYPSALAIDSANNLYIADWGGFANRVRKVDATGVIQSVVGNGDATYAGSGMMSGSAQLSPVGLDFSSDGIMYIADRYNDRVYSVSASGIFQLVAGNGTEGDGGDGGDATAATLYNPPAVAVDPCGNLIIPTVGHVSVATSGKRIRKVTLHAYSTPTVTVTGMSSATVGATVSVHAAVSGGVGAYRINWYRNGTLLAVTDTPGVTYMKGMGTDTISAHALPSVVYCSDSAVSGVWEVAEIPVGITDVRRMGVTIYPNPTRSMLHVNGEGPLEEVALETVTGQAIVNMHVQGLRAEMDMSGLPAGLYLLRVNRLQVYKIWRE